MKMHDSSLFYSSNSITFRLFYILNFSRTVVDSSDYEILYFMNFSASWPSASMHHS